MTTILTYDIRYLDLHDDETWRDLSIETIAYGLARKCRFAGQFNNPAIDFYSVADHSINMVEYYLHECRGGTKDVNWDLAMAMLMHDAAEAFIGDIPSPWKHADVSNGEDLPYPEFEDIFYWEYEFMGRISKRFGLKKLSAVDSALVKYYDRQICANEAMRLFVPIPQWAKDRVEIEIPVVISQNCQSAATRFISMFKYIAQRRVTLND